MKKLDIQINDSDTGQKKSVLTDGYFLLYLDDNSKMKVTGEFDIKILMPLLSKMVLEKMSK